MIVKLGLDLKVMKYYYVNKELCVDLFFVSGMSFFFGYNSFLCIQMFVFLYLSQKFNILEFMFCYCQLGMEYEFGKYMFSIKMFVDVCIIKVILWYIEILDESFIFFNF